ncbi:hypothetical protein BH11PLA2_BH11PLA2_17130 [soil metagenome]
MRTLFALVLLATTLFAAEKPKLVIITAEDEYKTEVTLPAYSKKYLDAYEVSFILADPKDKAHLPGLEQLKSADAVVLSVRRKPLLKDDLDEVKAYVASGKPLVALRTSSHAFALRKPEKLPASVMEWPTFGKDIIGCNYTNHTKQTLGTKLTVTAKEHPIMKGVPATFESKSGLYLSKPLEKDCVVLLSGTSDKSDEPVAWVREKSATHGKVAYIALAHETDFANDVFPVLLTNAIQWAVAK